MKIRTDFVTNSSSSSFCVEITLKTISGEELTTRIDPDDGGGNGSADLGCTGKEILQASDVHDLMKLLAESLEIREPSGDEPYFKKKFQNFVEEVTNKVPTIAEIDSVTLKRVWEAWGEGSSCFAWNLDCFAERLPELAQQINQSTGEEKETAKRELEKYLKEYDGYISSEWGGEFPSGFMGAEGNASIVWTKIADDIEAFAEKVISEDLPDTDYAEETVTVNLIHKTISNTAEYILGGNGCDEEEDEW